MTISEDLEPPARFANFWGHPEIHVFPLIGWAEFHEVLLEQCSTPQQAAMVNHLLPRMNRDALRTPEIQQLRELAAILSAVLLQPPSSKKRASPAAAEEEQAMG